MMYRSRSLMPLLFLFLATALSAQTNLTVTNGSRSTVRVREQRVNIWADPDPENMVFDRWIGDTTLVEDPTSAASFVNPLSKNIALTATYKPAPSWSLTEETINGVDVLYYIPPKRVGIIFRFHGSGGSAQSTLSSIESRIFSNDAVAAGYGIIALDSTDRVNGYWSFLPPPNNPDLTNIQAVITNFQQRGIISANDPIVAQGTSRGGVFSSVAAYYLNFKAAAIYIGFGVNSIMPLTTVPTIFCSAVNDDEDLVGPEGNQRAHDQAVSLQQRGIMASFNLHPATPVYPERFWRLANLTEADSHNIYNALKNGGFLDGRDLLIDNPRNTNWQSVIPPQYSPYISGISTILGSSYANHSFFSDYDSRVLSFYNSAINTARQRSN